MPFKNISDYKDNAHYMQTGGKKIAYWMNSWSEQKTHITLLHGFPSASWDWHNQWSKLEHDYNLLAVDFLGFGLSDKPKGHFFSIQEQADLVSRLLHHLRINQTNLVAHDYGVSVAQELLARSNDSQSALQVDKTLFLNGGLFAESHRPLFTQKVLASPLGWLAVKFLGKQKLKRTFDTIFGKDTPPSQEHIESIWTLLSLYRGTEVLPGLLVYVKERSIFRDRWVGAMQDSQDSIGFINGIQDPISGEHMLEQFKELFPKSATLSLDVGHYPQIESPASVSEAIKTFMQSNAQDL